MEDASLACAQLRGALKKLSLPRSGSLVAGLGMTERLRDVATIAQARRNGEAATPTTDVHLLFEAEVSVTLLLCLTTKLELRRTAEMASVIVASKPADDEDDEGAGEHDDDVDDDDASYQIAASIALDVAQISIHRGFPVVEGHSAAASCARTTGPQVAAAGVNVLAALGSLVQAIIRVALSAAATGTKGRPATRRRLATVHRIVEAVVASRLIHTIFDSGSRWIFQDAPRAGAQRMPPPAEQAATPLLGSASKLAPAEEDDEESPVVRLLR